jgi:hypothetical protein
MLSRLKGNTKEDMPTAFSDSAVEGIHVISREGG